MTKALVCIVNSRENVTVKSSIQKLFGDPDHYAYKLGNDTFAGTIPIFYNRLYFQFYGYLRRVSVDYYEQTVFFSNDFHQRLMHGLFVHNNDNRSFYYGAEPETDQVTV